MFDRLSEKFTDTLRNLSGKSQISEENIQEAIKEVRSALLEADVNFKVVKNFIEKVKEKALGSNVVRGVNPGEQFIKIVNDELTSLMGGEAKELSFKKGIVNPVLIAGLNGAGKTTFTGKLSLYLRSKRKEEVLLIPADNFRPAAKDQLMTLAKSLGVDCFDSDLSMSAKDIALAGMKEAEKLGKSVAIIDTAGRLQIDMELMGQLKEVREALEDPQVLLVVDAMTGQEAVNVAKEFHEQIGVTGAVLSKMDSDARGGAALSIREITNVPIYFFSSGEKMKDLEVFHPDRLAGRILDKGDVVSLVEKAQEVVDEKEAERMMKNLERNKFTIEDFMKQMETINKLGSMSSILKMLPGMGGILKQAGDLGKAEDEMTNMKVLVNSMTKQERRDHKLLYDSSRKERVAKGCGRTVDEVEAFVKKFEQMSEMMVGMMGMMKGGGLPNIPGIGQVKGFRQAKKAKKGKGGKKSPFGNKYF